MGGNVFKHDYKTVRLTTKELEVVSKEITELLSSFGIEYSIPRNVGEKEDHGDLDVLVTPEYVETFIVEYLEENNIPFNKNGSVLSFLHVDFQIDLISIPKDRMEFATFYFSFNDLGNLLGRTSKQLGFKLKHDGLYYVLRDDNHIIKEFLLTEDYKSFLKILEVDVELYEKGFDTYVDVFKFVSSSKYFNPEIFKFENLNHTNRVRDRKRKTYNMFLLWLECQKVEVKLKLTQAQKEAFVCSCFPALSSQILKARITYSVDKALKEKFNGRIIMSYIPELTGKDLGNFMKQFKDKHAMKFTALMLTLSEQEVKNLILEFYEIYKNESHTHTS